MELFYAAYDNVFAHQKDTGEKINVGDALRQLDAAGFVTPIDMGYHLENVTWFYSDPHGGEDDERLVGAYWMV